MSCLHFPFPSQVYASTARETCWISQVWFSSHTHPIPNHLPSISLGNTCYMNATVQALRALPELQAALNM